MLWSSKEIAVCIQITMVKSRVKYEVEIEQLVCALLEGLAMSSGETSFTEKGMFELGLVGVSKVLINAKGDIPGTSEERYLGVTD